MIGWATLGVTAVQTAAAVGQYKAQKEAAGLNLENLEERYKLRSKQRFDNLREMLGAQHMAFVSQATDPGSVSAQIVGRETIAAHQLDNRLDALDTLLGVQNERTRSTSALVGMVSQVAGSAGSYLQYRADTRLKPTNVKPETRAEGSSELDQYFDF